MAEANARRWSFGTLASEVGKIVGTKNKKTQAEIEEEERKRKEEEEERKRRQTASERGF